jgi:hypothetical protein
MRSLVATDTAIMSRSSSDDARSSRSSSPRVRIHLYARSGTSRCFTPPHGFAASHRSATNHENALDRHPRAELTVVAA